MATESRRRILQVHGASTSAADELMAYNSSNFTLQSLPTKYPLPDEAFVGTWAAYEQDAAPGEVFSFLCQKLVQFRFPIMEGIRSTADYRLATARGILPEDGHGLALAIERPEELRLEIHQTPAGRIPILFTPNRRDFVSLVHALTMRNEPGLVPDSMGACLVSGYNNWDRVRTYRAKWAETLGHEPSDEEWGMEFQSFARQKDLYQDKFILLSGGCYSAVSADAIGFDADTWRALSVVIRREHECAHYFTRRVLSSTRNNLLDELIADYCGIIAAAGEYRADWARHFLGLEDFPSYRAGARLENYRGKMPLSDEAFHVLQSLVNSAIESLRAYWERQAAFGLPHAVIGLSRLTLEELASEDILATKAEDE